MDRKDNNPNAQNIFGELKLLRGQLAASQKQYAELKGKVDARELGITLQQHNKVRDTLRDLLVAVENIYIPDPGSQRSPVRPSAALSKAMEQADKVVRPNRITPTEVKAEK